MTLALFVRVSNEVHAHLHCVHAALFRKCNANQAAMALADNMASNTEEEKEAVKMIRPQCRKKERPAIKTVPWPGHVSRSRPFY